MDLLEEWVDRKRRFTRVEISRLSKECIEETTLELRQEWRDNVVQKHGTEALDLIESGRALEEAIKATQRMERELQSVRKRNSTSLQTPDRYIVVRI